MKSFYVLLLAVFGSWNIAQSQTIVSTQLSNRNVVIEEFTGMHGLFCPDGHRMLNDLVTKYQDKVFPLNIHYSGYAKPDLEHTINMTTPEGDQIAVEKEVVAIPSGAVNRTGDPRWAISRKEWEENVQNIISQQSPVNLAVQANVDPSTRELHVLVEYYYTQDEAHPNNKLTVVLAQSEIVAYQNNGGHFNPEYFIDDELYRHLHVYRMPLTESVWGEAITQTTAGTFGSREYTIILPEAIGNVPLDLGHLEVVAFIAPDKEDIITAAGTDVEIPAANKVKLLMEDITEISGPYFFDTFNPKVRVTNEFDTEVTQFDVDLIVNDEVFTQTFTGQLQKNQSVVVDFGVLDADFTGNYTIQFKGFENINNSDVSGNLLVDLNKYKNFSKIEGIHFVREAFDETLFSFDSSTENYALSNLENNPHFQVYSSPDPIGANNTNEVVLYSLSLANGIQGVPAELLFGEANLSILQEAKFKYYYAYNGSQLGGTAPEIVVSVSDDDGISWQEIARQSITENTYSMLGSIYYPTDDGYIQDSVDLSAYFGRNVIIKLSVIPGTDGNLLWIDEVSLEGTIEDGGIINSNLSELDFSEIQVGNSVQKEVSISNTGKAPLEISSITILNDNFDVFSVKQLGDNLTIPAGESLDIEVSFLPVDTEVYESELWISSSDKKTPKTKIDLRGEGAGSSIADNLIEDASIKLMPNPVKESGNLEFVYSGTQTIESAFSVVDLNGKEVANLGIHTIYNGRNTFSLQFADLVSGLYFIRLESGAVLLEQLPVIIER